MKKCVISLVLCICAAVLLLAACHKEEQPAITESQVWETMPQLTYGVLESEKLEVLPWYDGRTEAASQCNMAETELGYYWMLGELLFYADKADLSNWVVVCNKPDCTHSYTQTNCNAQIGNHWFLLRDGRIISTAYSALYPELYPNQKKHGTILVSRAADGTDLRLLYALEDIMVGDEGGLSAALLTSHQLLMYSCKNQTDGSEYYNLYRLSKDGIQLIEETTMVDSNRTLIKMTRGDDVIAVEDLHVEDDEFIANTVLCRFDGGVKTPVYETVEWGYLTGNTMRVFRKNDGYYDINTDTGEETLLTPTQFENSACFLLLPNCILETTLAYNTQDVRTPDMTHQMTLFDGVVWREVRLPKELKAAKPTTYAHDFVVTSDSVFFTVSTMERTFALHGGGIYRIDLSKEELTAELCQEIIMP